MIERKVIVIGAGLGGLATSLRLANAGWNVHLLEKSESAGGKLNRFSSDGFVFDTGPSLLTLPELFSDVLSLAGKNFWDLNPKRIDPLFRYIFDDSSELKYTSSLPDISEQIRNLTGSETDVAGFLNFLELGRRIFDLSTQTFFRTAPFSSFNISDLMALIRSPKRQIWGSYSKTIDKFFKDPRIKQIFNRYPTYVGSSPYQAPAMLALIPYMELIKGGWYVPGGLYEIVTSIMNNLPENIEFHPETQVTSINSDGQRWLIKAASGKTFKSEIVVCNVDPETVWDISGGSYGQKHKEKDLSMSGIVALVGHGGQLEKVSHHTVTFSSNYPEEFDSIFRKHQFPDDPTVYINIPSISDPTVAPKGSQGIFIMANAPAIGSQWTDKHTDLALERIRKRLKKTVMDGLLDKSNVLDIWSPSRLEQDYSAPRGAIYGRVSHGWRNSFLRPPIKTEKSPAMYFVGGGTHPGGGTPTVLMSAQIVSRKILQDYA